MQNITIKLNLPFWRPSWMPSLNLQLRKFQNYILYIRNKHSLQLKQISLIKILKIYLCMKKKRCNLSSLAAIFDAILYKGSLIN